MECKQQIGIFFILIISFIIDGTSANSTPEISSTQDEVITYVNHTAKLSCIIQNKNRQHVLWSRINYMNETQRLADVLFVGLHKYTPLRQYHLTHLIETENREYWNLEIRHVHLSDQGYYSCALAAVKPKSKIFYVKVIENTRNPSHALRSTSEIQRRAKSQTNSSLPLKLSSKLPIALMIILLLIM